MVNIQGIIYFILIIVGSLTVCLLIGIPLVRQANREKEAADDAAKRTQMAIAQEVARRRKVAENVATQEALVKQYVESPVLGDILTELCHGDYRFNKPSQIFIYNDRIEAICNGARQSYDFIAGRVTPLQYVCERYGITDRTYRSEKDFVRPQVAMAEAINQRMGDAYAISDKAERKFQPATYDGEDTSYTNYY